MKIAGNLAPPSITLPTSWLIPDLQIFRIATCLYFWRRITHEELSIYYGLRRPSLSQLLKVFGDFGEFFQNKISYCDRLCVRLLWYWVCLSYSVWSPHNSNRLSLFEGGHISFRRLRHYIRKSRACGSDERLPNTTRLKVILCVTAVG